MKELLKFRVWLLWLCCAACGPTQQPPMIHQPGRFGGPHRLPVRQLLVSGDGSALGTMDAEAIHLWRLPSFELEARIEVPDLEFALRVALSSSGHQVAVWTRNQTLWLWPDLNGGVSVAVTAPRVAQHLIGFDEGGRLLWVDAEGEVLRGVEDPEVIGRLTEAPFDITGNARRGFLLWGRESAWVRCAADPEGTCTLKPIEGFWGRWQPDIAPLGIFDRVILAARGSEVMPLDLSARGMVEPWSVPKPAGEYETMSAFALSPDERVLVTALFSEARLVWWSVGEGQVVGTTKVPPEEIDPLWPRPILDAVLTDPRTLWVLLPEQRLLRYNVETRSFDGAWTL